MKTLIAIALALAVSPALAAEPVFPELTGPVVDIANQIPDADEAKLSTDLESFQKRTGHQIVIVTVPDLGDMPPSDYAYRIGRHWGIGRKGVDDGLVLLQSPGDGRPGSGKVFIAVGYGLEATVTDADSSRVYNGIMLPILKGEPGTVGDGLERDQRVSPALIAGATELMKIASVTPEQRREFEAKAAAERKRAWQEAKATMENIVAFLFGGGCLGGAGWGVWRFATRKERARRKAEKAERDRLAAIAAAERKRIADEEAERAAEARRQAILLAKREREAMLAAMTPEKRAAFLAEEERQRQLARERALAEEQRRKERIRREREAAQAAQATAAAEAAKQAARRKAERKNDDSEDEKPVYRGGGGSFGGGGAGGSY